MVALRSPSILDCAKTLETSLDRLAGANGRLQLEIAQSLGLCQTWITEALLWAMIEHVPDFLFIKDLEGRYIMANRGIPGREISADEIIGKTAAAFHRSEFAAKIHADEQLIARSGQPLVNLEEYTVDADGRKIWFSVSRFPLRDDASNIVGFVGISRDVTARKAAEEEVQFLAHHDSLTRLPNRSLLGDRLAQAILHAERHGLWVAVAYVDLDNFKLINDGLGHAAGDELLKVAAARMVGSVRATDTVVRLGGDEFVILLAEQPQNVDAISAAVEKIREAISQPMKLEGQTIRVTSSMGLATYPNDGNDAETLLKNADAAMYQAKAAGRDNFRFFTEELNVKVHDRLSLQVELREGIARKQFHLVYQPQIELKTGRVFAVEALVRWDHPTLGGVLPDRFIPIAEETGLIVPLGDWVLHEACRQNKAWQDAGISPVSICVNVSARQFREKNWTQRVNHALEESGLSPHYLELELTESLIMQDVDQAVATMHELQAIGVHFSIDDFGTGYSSLSALKTFPVARLKIDRCFVRNLPHNEDDKGITTAIISLGQKLNMKVIAEGVETDEQMAFLTANHCDEIQGYHFSRPIRAHAFAKLMLGQERDQSERISSALCPRAV